MHEDKEFHATIKWFGLIAWFILSLILSYNSGQGTGYRQALVDVEMIKNMESKGGN